MRRDVFDLRQFYATRLGKIARQMVARKLSQAWGDGQGLDMLGLGYATPFLELFRSKARRTVATMPAAQGVEVWPHPHPHLHPMGALDAEPGTQRDPIRGLSCLSDERALPHPNALFDRILMIHALEESDDPLGVMREVGRVMAPSGRVIIVAANRRGAWANSEATPFGHGRPFTRAQLENLVREAGLEPTAWSRALYLPPVAWMASWAEALEQAGARLWPGLSGLILLEAVKQTFAVKPKGHSVRARVAQGALQPLPSPSTGRDSA
jgi:SAM-dependent methyltransferase